MRSQKSEIDSLQLQLTQAAQKIRSSVERELRETFQTVKDERDQFCDLVKNLEASVKDLTRKLAAMSKELEQGKEELQLAYSHTEELKVELGEKNSLMAEEADKVALLERQLDSKTHHCNDLEREINHTRHKLEEQARLKKVTATQTLPDPDIVERDEQIAGLEDKLMVTERRIKDALDQLSRTAKERDSLRGQLNDVTESTSAMQLKLEGSSVTISNLELDLKQSADSISRLERTIAEKEKRSEMMERAADEMKSTISSLVEENAALKQRQVDNDKLGSLVSSLERKNFELTAQVSSLSEKLRANSAIDREILLQKDEAIAQLKLELDAERQCDKARLTHGDSGVSQQESNVGEIHREVDRQRQQEMTALQSRVCEEEQQLEKSDNGKLTEEHNARVVSIFILFCCI